MKTLATLVFNPTGTVATAGNVTDGTNGLTTPGKQQEHLLRPIYTGDGL